MEKAEFEHHVTVWLDLVLGAHERYAERMHLAGLEVGRDDDDQLREDMARAQEYEDRYLPESVLASFLDKEIPADIMARIESGELRRSDLLLHVGALQREEDWEDAIRRDGLWNLHRGFAYAPDRRH